MITTHPRRRAARFALACALTLLCSPWLTAAAQGTPDRTSTIEQRLNADEEGLKNLHFWHEINEAMIRLPLAAVLGATLALRFRRKGTPKRTPAVVQTQIILAVVGAMIMIVVGSSLARAFGIVGAANLIRYRSKIEDPKDAVVMLATLSLGLASGVGLYALAIFSTVFLTVALWIIESFEPTVSKQFNLKIKAGEETDALRAKIEKIFDGFDLKYELRTSSDEEVCYDVKVPHEVQTDDVSTAILKLDPEGHASVDWADKKKK